MSVSGSLGSFTAKKITFRVANDADVTRTLGKWEKEEQATSGDPNIKLTKQVEIAEGFDLVVDGAQRENLRDLINEITPFGISYTTAEGSNYTCDGQITSTGDGTQDGKVTIKVIPAKNAGWTPTVV